MIKSIIFDLDNTLFDQVDYIKNLMSHIASRLSKTYNLDTDTTSKLFFSYWIEKGPFYGHFFDDMVEKLSINKNEVKNLIDISHTYKPNTLPLYPEVDYTLKKLQKKYKLAMITDGNEQVQKNKVEALGIKKYFSKIFYATKKNMKPSASGYLAILEQLNLKPDEALYVGDNPKVDFITPNKMNMPTLRVLTGYFKNEKLDSQHEAKHAVYNLEKIFDVLEKLERK